MSYWTLVLAECQRLRREFPHGQDDQYLPAARFRVECDLEEQGLWTNPTTVLKEAAGEERDDNGLWRPQKK